MQVAIPSAINNGEYRVEVDDLPPEYTLNSLQYGTPGAVVDLTKDPLRVLAQDAVQSQQLPTIFGALVIFPSSVLSAKTLTVVLSKNPVPAAVSGAKVMGMGLPSEVPIFLSGVPGTLYADGSFEFTGVKPGRHSLVRFISSQAPPHAAIVVVGEGDVANVKLTASNILPWDIENDKPRPLAAHAPGTALPLALLRGRVVNESSGEALTLGGAVTITGYRAKRTYAIDTEGRFEIRDLLPGIYRLESAITGYESSSRDIVIDDGDTEVAIRCRLSVNQ